MNPTAEVVVECILAVVGGERPVVERGLSLAARDGGGTALEPDAHLAADEALGAGRVGGEVLVVGAEPEAVVDELGVFGSDLPLQLQLLLREGHRLEGTVGGEEDGGGGGPRRSRGS